MNAFLFFITKYAHEHQNIQQVNKNKIKKNNNKVGGGGGGERSYQYAVTATTKKEERLHTKYPPSVKLQGLFVLVYPQTSHKHTSPIAVHLLLNRDHFHHLLQRGDGYFV